MARQGPSLDMEDHAAYQRQEQEPSQGDTYDPPPVRRECNDVFFLVLFLALVIMVVYFAAAFGHEFVDATKLQDVAEKASGFNVLLRLIGYSGLAAIGMSLVWIGIMILAGELLIWLALAMIFALNVAAAYFGTKMAYDNGVKYYWWPAAVFGLSALLLVLYVCCIHKRIKFAAAHLKVAGSAVFRLPMTLVVATVMVFAQFGWAVCWVVGSLGIMFHQDYIKVSSVCTSGNCQITTSSGAVIGVLFGMLVIYFWGSFVLKNIVGVTVAGTVAAWKNASNAAFITMGAWLRAMTLNLGSICFGSLVVAILEAIRQILNLLMHMASESGNCAAACLIGCVSCLIGCIESWIEFFNRFAYTYVGCYGYSFVTASRHVFQLFKSKGWSAIVNDDLTNNVFFMGNLTVGAITAYIGVRLVHDTDKSQLTMFDKPEAIVGFFAFFVGYSINNLFMSVIASAVTTVFVLWAEDPHGWELTRPDHYATLHNAWLKVYPEEYNNGYGKRIDNHA
ncbi:TPA: hypothetical protein N0F65_002363 [Lagenidium giganteum]|uniref:Choline transporter-like protein n=1 Tax=Lagenidium giganteum TaxID=4803 RepID=A0AAV2YM84_9STRA|nr:TPA: hypothetical protein N0F65_002363 [Lagenidium giganteum]